MGSASGNSRTKKRRTDHLVELLRKLNEEGITLLMVTHILARYWP
jgi:energy-coupling factor transporter ATP-binding protein EcfA2